mmetsp:Transcript_16907/g.18815  ORF Transcript_16907/g.18815 Transcript_16907/m.18815 type:complete len:957 (+) Transcript_16907:128-2998(+)
MNALEFGELGWVKVIGYPYWPARRADVTEASENVQKQGSDDLMLVYFFGSHDYAWVDPKDRVKKWEEFFQKFTVTKKKNKMFQEALEEAYEYIKKNWKRVPTRSSHAMRKNGNDKGSSRALKKMIAARKKKSKVVPVKKKRGPGRPRKYPVYESSSSSESVESSEDESSEEEEESSSEEDESQEFSSLEDVDLSDEIIGSRRRLSLRSSGSTVDKKKQVETASRAKNKNTIWRRRTTTRKAKETAKKRLLKSSKLNSFGLPKRRRRTRSSSNSVTSGYESDYSSKQSASSMSDSYKEKEEMSEGPKSDEETQGNSKANDKEEVAPKKPEKLEPKLPKGECPECQEHCNAILEPPSTARTYIHREPWHNADCSPGYYLFCMAEARVVNMLKNNRPYKCVYPKCSCAFFDLFELRDHVDKEHKAKFDAREGEQLACLYDSCEEVFEGLDARKQRRLHIETNHLGIGRKNCEGCSCFSYESITIEDPQGGRKRKAGKEAQEPPPFKRGRGRPRKYPKNPPVEEIPVPELSQPKRRRGRPRKYPRPDDRPQVVVVKKGPGRPRKYPRGAATRNNSEPKVNTDAPVQVRKRGPGRPRKRSFDESMTTNEMLLHASQVPSFTVQKRRGPGRPRKDIADGLTAYIPPRASFDATTPVGHSSRGRPLRKSRRNSVDDLLNPGGNHVEVDEMKSRVPTRSPRNVQRNIAPRASTRNKRRRPGRPKKEEKDTHSDDEYVPPGQGGHALSGMGRLNPVVAVNPLLVSGTLGFSHSITTQHHHNGAHGGWTNHVPRVPPAPRIQPPPMMQTPPQHPQHLQQHLQNQHQQTRKPNPPEPPRSSSFMDLVNLCSQERQVVRPPAKPILPPVAIPPTLGRMGTMGNVGNVGNVRNMGHMRHTGRTHINTLGPISTPIFKSFPAHQTRPMGGLPMNNGLPMNGSHVITRPINPTTKKGNPLTFLVESALKPK